MSPPQIWLASRNAISSPESASGLTPCAVLDGRMTDRSGQALAPASLSALPESRQALLTSATFGPSGSGSLTSGALAQSLASKSQVAMDLHGLTKFRAIWKVRATPGGAVDICAAGFGGSHIRQRIYWVYSDPRGIGDQRLCAAPAFGASRQGRAYRALDLQQIVGGPFVPGSSHAQPLLRKGIDASTNWMEQVRAYGNGLDAETATQFCAAVMECLP